MSRVEKTIIALYAAFCAMLATQYLVERLGR